MAAPLILAAITDPTRAPSVIVLATLDTFQTKQETIRELRERIRAHGIN